MILTRHNTLLFLVHQGLLSLDDLVKASLAVHAHGQRNRGFSVTWPNGQGYYVKQHRPDAGPWEARSSVVNEARVLRLIGHGNVAVPGAPTLRCFDRWRQALVTDWQVSSAPCASLAIADLRTGTAVATLLGKALAELHGHLRTSGKEDLRGQPFCASAPWVMRFDRLHPLAGEDQSWAQAKLVTLIGHFPDLLTHLCTLAETWPAQQLIHGDMKWQNCIVHRKDGGPPGCLFIDWEMACLGDPLWDLAGLAQSWLKHWSDTLPPDLGHRARLGAEATLAPVQTALGALFTAYRVTSLSADPERFVRLCGARLVQTLYEECWATQEIANAHVMLLQLAQNLLAHPGQHVHDLLGEP
ncbi:aminoglycoside phosphotransferase family protein [Halomonas sp. EF61]|uniref:phosphotransferase family protein n=1 Tax=Halomonas sp. EF61 TaxID=2950869 RepID=UPI0032E0439D